MKEALRTRDVHSQASEFNMEFFGGELARFPKACNDMIDAFGYAWETAEKFSAQLHEFDRFFDRRIFPSYPELIAFGFVAGVVLWGILG